LIYAIFWDFDTMLTTKRCFTMARRLTRQSRRRCVTVHTKTQIASGCWRLL
jgi:hypothetical protein